ncbi:hypothetical protein HHK36_027547 [Tetracentron sinense]|uniref:DUF7356 domain-containing protein n=1 Tax=Tetracentron sinense TaxID=13715 RepID=A0A835D159_TETSI|nr:hypothetical protein HHK36_027547 [Tetracentron sinense]
MERNCVFLVIFALTLLFIDFSGAELKVGVTNLSTGLDPKSSLPSNDKNSIPSDSKVSGSDSLGSVKVDKEKKDEDQDVESHGVIKNDPGKDNSGKQFHSKEPPKVGTDKDGSSMESRVKGGDKNVKPSEGSESKVVHKEGSEEGGSVSSKPLRKESSHGEECDSSNRCTDENNKLTACLRVPGNESPDLSLFIQNKGKDPLTINISAPDFVQLEIATIQLQEKESKKLLLVMLVRYVHIRRLVVYHLIRVSENFPFLTGCLQPYTMVDIVTSSDLGNKDIPIRILGFESARAVDTGCLYLSFITLDLATSVLLLEVIEKDVWAMQVKVSFVEGGNGNEAMIVLKAGNGGCNLDFRDLIMHNSIKKTKYSPKSTYFNLLMPTPSIMYMSLGALLLLASAWMCARFRRRHLPSSEAIYQKLETELPLSGGGKTESDHTSGWENSWGDNWDDVEAPMTPTKPVTPSLSSKGLASRRLIREGWKD